jgi:hypothetical protein
VENVAVEGPVTGSSVVIAAGTTVITRAVFYRGPAENEVVVGSVDVNAAGDIAVTLVEPADASATVIVDE